MDGDPSQSPSSEDDNPFSFAEAVEIELLILGFAEETARNWFDLKKVVSTNFGRFESYILAFTYRNEEDEDEVDGFLYELKEKGIIEDVPDAPPRSVLVQPGVVGRLLLDRFTQVMGN